MSARDTVVLYARNEHVLTPRARAWALSNLDDGAYIVDYSLYNDAFRFFRYEPGGPYVEIDASSHLELRRRRA